MNLLKISLVACFLFCACNSTKSLSPSEAAQQTCACMKLSKDTSEEGVKAFTECNTKTREMMAEYRSDTLWMSQWKDALMQTLKDCMSE